MSKNRTSSSGTTATAASVSAVRATGNPATEDAATRRHSASETTITITARAAR